MRPLFVLSLIGLLACSSSSQTTTTADAGTSVANLDSKNYDQSCQHDSECVVVNQRPCDACSGGALPASCSGDGAINVTDRDRWAADWAARNATCPKTDPVPCPTICAVISPYCKAGTCAVCTSLSCTSDGG